MDGPGATLPPGLVDLATDPEALCLAFAGGRTIDPPDDLQALFTCVAPGDGPLDGVHPSSQATAVSLFQQARRHGHAIGDIRLAADDGSVRLHLYDLTAKLGCFAGIVVPVRDHEDPGPMGLNQVPPPRRMVLRSDVAGVITWTDEATTRALGWSAEELVGRSALDFIDAEDHERSIVFWVEVLQEAGATRRLRQRWWRRDGTSVWMETTQTNHLQDPDLAAVVIELVDISDEMAAQTALREREELLARLTEALPIGVLQVDSAGETVFSNPRWFEIADLSPGAPLADLVSLADSDDRVTIADALTTTRSSGVDQVLVIGINTPAGNVRTCRLRLCALGRHEDGHSVLASLEDITESHKLQRRLVEQAERDPLTGLLNRTAIMDRLAGVIESARAHQHGAAVLFIDLDDFKSVNDRYGHAAGDDLLRTVAQRIRDCVRANDLVGRLGGDEFVVVTPDLPAAGIASELARRLEIEIRGIVLGGGERLVTGSIGVAVIDEITGSSAELLALADRRMYETKRTRRRRAVS